jgi:hypothetical protein
MFVKETVRCVKEVCRLIYELDVFDERLLLQPIPSCRRSAIA